MTTVAEMIHHAKEVRQRLLNPPNAVEDDGIDLKRKPKPHISTPKEEADTVLEHHISFCGVSIITDIPVTEEPKPLKLMTIVSCVAAGFGITLLELISERREKRIVLPRHVACHLGFKHTGLSKAAIGRRLHRDHTTIMHALKTIERRMIEEPELATKIAEIETALLSLPYDPKTHHSRPAMAAESQRDMEVWKPARLPESQVCAVDKPSRSISQIAPVSNDNGVVQGQDHPEPTH